jgi:hypothetical protein
MIHGCFLLDYCSYTLQWEFRGQYIKIELLQDIQASISQLESGTGIGHDAAKADVLERVAN